MKRRQFYCFVTGSLFEATSRSSVCLLCGDPISQREFVDGRHEAGEQIPGRFAPRVVASVAERPGFGRHRRAA